MIPQLEITQQGSISIEQDLYIGVLIGDFGLQVAKDGRIWICLNDQALIRFKPLTNEMIKLLKKKGN